MDKQTLLLSAADIKKKIERISYEILENNDEENEIIIIGIRDNGYRLAEKLVKYLKKFSDLKITLGEVRMNKAKPASQEVVCSLDDVAFDNKVVVLVDDVANTGRTLLYAMKPFMARAPRKIQIAVLVDRKHKMFPVSADYVGMLLSTNMQEHVSVELEKEEAVYLS
jgi:pyrimidine operon attenuation protein/uracil phosphoribosyltransferase